MDTLYFIDKGKGRGNHEYSPYAVGGGRTNVPHKDVIGGITRHHTMNVEYTDPDAVKASPQCDPNHCLTVTPKKCLYSKGPKLENMPNEKEYVQEQRLKFI